MSIQTSLCYPSQSLIETKNTKRKENTLKESTNKALEGITLQSKEFTKFYTQKDRRSKADRITRTLETLYLSQKRRL